MDRNKIAMRSFAFIMLIGLMIVSIVVIGASGKGEMETKASGFERVESEIHKHVEEDHTDLH